MPKIASSRHATVHNDRKTAFESVVKDAKQFSENAKFVEADKKQNVPKAHEVESIEKPDASKGLVRYITNSGEHLIANEDKTPKLYDRITEQYYVNKAIENGSVLNVDNTPSLFLETVNNIDASEASKGVIAFEVGSIKYVVGESYSPDTFARLEKLESSAADGYSVQSRLPEDPDLAKLKFESLDDETGMIRYSYNGDKHLISPSGSDAARQSDYELIKAAYESQGHIRSTALENALKNKNHIVRDTDAPYSLDQIQTVHPYSEGGVIDVTLKNGEKLFVLDKLSPEAFQQYQDYERALKGINKAQEDGYKLASADDYLPSMEDVKSVDSNTYGPGLVSIVFQKPGGAEEKLLISNESNPAFFDKVKSFSVSGEANSAGVSDIRQKYSVPADTDINVGKLATTEKSEDGTAYSVDDLTMKSLVDDYKKGIADGSIAGDDPRAKFIRALEAKAAAENGMTIIPEHGAGPDKSAVDPINVTSRDVRDEIFDVKNIDETLSKSFANETILKDITSKRELALAQVEGGDTKVQAVEKALADHALSDDYYDYILDLQKSGYASVAEETIKQTYSSLMDADPEKAAQFAKDMQLNAYTTELEHLYQNPGLISDSNTALAGQDVTMQVLRGLKLLDSDIPRRGFQVFELFVHDKIGRDKSLAADWGKVTSELGDVYRKTGDITTEDIDRVINSAPVDNYQKTEFRSNLQFLKDAGILGSLGGSVSAFRTIYQLTEGKHGGTSTERAAVAADFLTLLSSSEQFSKFGAGIYDSVKGTEAYKLLGLDKTTIPDVWQNESNWDVPENKERLHQVISDSIVNSSLKSEPYGNAHLDKLQNSIPEIEAGIEASLAKNSPLKPDIIHRIAGSAVKVMTGIGDLGSGIANIVVGGLTLDAGIKNGDKLQIAEGAFGVTGGTAGLYAAYGSIGTYLGFSGRAVAIAGPVGMFASAVLSIPGIVLGIIKSDKLHDQSMKNYETMQQYAGDGLLKDNGLENYVWLQGYLRTWGQRDAPTDKSVFDTRRDEWQSGETEQYKLAEKHQDYDEDGSNRLSIDQSTVNSDNLTPPN